MGIREAAHSLQTTKNPNPKRFFPDLGIHDPKGSSHKEHLDKNTPRSRPFQVPRKTGLLEIKKRLLRNRPFLKETGCNPSIHKI